MTHDTKNLKQLWRDFKATGQTSLSLKPWARGMALNGNMDAIRWLERKGSFK